MAATKIKINTWWPKKINSELNEFNMKKHALFLINNQNMEISSLLNIEIINLNWKTEYQRWDTWHPNQYTPYRSTSLTWVRRGRWSGRDENIPEVENHADENANSFRQSIKYKSKSPKTKYELIDEPIKRLQIKKIEILLVETSQWTISEILLQLTKFIFKVNLIFRTKITRNARIHVEGFMMAALHSRQ